MAASARISDRGNRFAGKGKGGADAQGRADDLPGDVDGLGGTAAYLFGDRGDLVDAVDLGQQNEYLVTARPPDRIAPADAFADPRCQCCQHVVADGMPPRVVDLLEVVDVAEQDPDVRSERSRLLQARTSSLPMASARLTKPVRVSNRANRSSRCSASTWSSTMRSAAIRPSALPSASTYVFRGRRPSGNCRRRSGRGTVGGPIRRRRSVQGRCERLRGRRGGCDGLKFEPIQQLDGTAQLGLDGRRDPRDISPPRRCTMMSTALSARMR